MKEAIPDTRKKRFSTKKRSYNILEISALEPVLEKILIVVSK